MMQDDPIRKQKADRWNQLTQRGVDPSDATDMVEREFEAASFTNRDTASVRRPAQDTTPAQTSAQPKPAPTQFIRSALQGAFLGTPDEIEAAGRGVYGAARRAVGLPGETYGEAVEDVRGKLKAFREESPKAAFATEMAGGLLTGGLAGGTKTVIGRALMNPAVSGAISGAAGADGDLMNRVKGAAVGAGAGKIIGTVLTPTRTLQRDVVQDVAAAQSPAGSRIGRALSDLRNKAATGMEKSQRFAADVLENRGFGKAARAIEPVDERTIQRAVNKNLPGTGLTEGAIEQQAQQASSIASRQADIAKAVGDEVQAVQVETVNRGKALAERAVEQSKARAEAILAEARQKAQKVVGESTVPRGTAAAIRDQIRDAQQRQADVTYKVIDSFGPPKREPIAVYDAVRKIPQLNAVLNEVLASQDAQTTTNRLAKATGGALFEPLEDITRRTVSYTSKSGKQVQMPEITLKTMDEMRRVINEKVSAALAGKETGLTPTIGRKLLRRVDVLETRYLDAFDDSARDAIKSARAPYRENFVALEALQDGLNLSGTKADKPSKLLSGSPKALDQLVKRVQMKYTDPVSRTAFQAGGREWFSALISDRLDDALKFSQMAVKTETSRNKVALVFGKDMVEQMQQIAALADRSTGIAAKGAARAEKITAMGERAAEKLGDRLRPEVFGQRDLADVTAEQAAEIANRLAAAKQARTALAPGGREAAASFVDVTLPGLMTEARGTVQDYGASAVQREIAGLDAPTALARLQQLQGNPAARALFGSQLDRTIDELQKRTVGSLVRPALAGAAGRRVGGLFTGRDE